MGLADNYPVDYYRDYSDMVRTELSDGSALLTEVKRIHGVYPMERAQHWLIFPNAIPVAFCESLFKSKEDAHRLTLCDIEVRDEYRGAGLTREIVRAVEFYYNEETMWTTGSFTPEGAKALGFLPVLPDHCAEVRFRSMNFVRDWNNLIPK